MLPQDPSRMLPLCMAVYGSAHGSVRTGETVCAQSRQCARQCLRLSTIVYDQASVLASASTGTIRRMIRTNLSTQDKT
jgi:hypothetical protein